jgi:hypothetical protein
MKGAAQPSSKPNPSVDETAPARRRPLQELPPSPEEENCTYDQILGDTPPSTGRADLEILGMETTPPLYKKAHEFVLLANTHGSGILRVYLTPPKKARIHPVLRRIESTSAKMNFRKVDCAPEEVLNRTLSKATVGDSRPFPIWAPHPPVLTREHR